jgi:hypothetical protein
MRRLFTLTLLASILAAALFGAIPARADSSGQLYNCYQQPRLGVGLTGRVTLYPNLPNTIRSTPGYGAKIGSIPAGGLFTVIGGPQCISGIYWWQVNYNGQIGWTAEGDGYYTYWLEPFFTSPPPPTCTLPNRLWVGGQGRVTPGLPNIVRSAPGTRSSGANSVEIGSIPGSGVFSVIGGPECGSDGRWWWYVNYNGLIGWTAEGEGTSNYWVEPWYGSGSTVCPGFMPSRLNIGGQGRVTLYPNLPNRMREFPSYQGFVTGSIPAGGVFTVLDGPNCAQNTAWWLVNYNGVVGWTAEGSGSQYWLEPNY